MFICFLLHKSTQAILYINLQMHCNINELHLCYIISEPQGMSYIETSNLDGETNLKIRQVRQWRHVCFPLRESILHCRSYYQWNVSLLEFTCLHCRFYYQWIVLNLEFTLHCRPYYQWIVSLLEFTIHCRPYYQWIVPLLVFTLHCNFITSELYHC